MLTVRSKSSLRFRNSPKRLTHRRPNEPRRSSHRFAWPRLAGPAGEPDRPVQFSLSLLPARNRGRAKLLPRPLGTLAKLNTNPAAVGAKTEHPLLRRG